MKPDSGTLVHLLSKNQEIKRAEISEEGDGAELVYQTLKAGKKPSLLKVELKTGRFHQIRVQLSASVHPIIGDMKYGSKEKTEDNSIMLSATELTFKTATTDEIKDVKINYPEWWNKKVRG